MDLPLTMKVSPSATVAVPRPAAAPPVLLRRVAAVMTAGAVALSLTAVPVLVPTRPPSVRVEAAAVVPPAAPENSTLLAAVALVKEVVPRRSVAVAPAIVADTFDL